MSDLTNLPSLDSNTAQALLREAAIDRQRQSKGSISPEAEQNIRMGKQDQSIGWDDAVYAFENAPKLSEAVEMSLSRQT